MARSRGEFNVHPSRRSKADEAAALRQNNGPPVSSSRMKRLVVLLMASLITLEICELGLRLLWHNPYHHASPEQLLAIPMHHPNLDRIYSRALLDPENP